MYLTEHLAHTPSFENEGYNVSNLEPFWADKKVAEISARSCREYASNRPQAAARRDLETLRAAVNYWHKEYGPLPAVPAVTLPPKSEPRDRWLTRKEAARLLRAARRTPHLARFILIGLYTGSRSAAIFNLQWSWIDFRAGVMRRRAPGATETKKRTPPVKLGRKILTHLRRWKRIDGGKHVVQFKGEKIASIKRSWRRACKKAKLKRVTPHTLRHTRATWQMQAGVDLWEAAGHLGMSVETLTRIYGKHSPDYQKRAAEV